ncbi:TetR/AcrR family transcriptional regulator [Streptomonospora wellingtoniae]|uniref:TetR/AcrR family transcriptional regulator n=1 Tax=Streptomonospora wellingtoniae TaxID=3075544 RepID=A0ABU2L1N0_9ACTN|nr:TetR/AcrR family transcriptional regulator [Streptomonospora sp. DSM 45055]MDT0305168.1 TetR/AcrR family transcriptional regulator [Streptomonospora sp. DSM 45055]
MPERANRRLPPDERRRQIVAATIDTVAALGLQQATFARIAERGGLSSTRLISYHFASRRELLRAAVLHVHGMIGAHVAERMHGAADARGELLAYIRAVVEFIDAHRTEMRALLLIHLQDDPGAERTYDAGTERGVLGAVEDVLDRGQRAGLFREFDTFVMAATVQRAVDGVPFLLQSDPGLDLARYADELAALFDHATAAHRPDRPMPEEPGAKP